MGIGFFHSAYFDLDGGTLAANAGCVFRSNTLSFYQNLSKRENAKAYF